MLRTNVPGAVRLLRRRKRWRQRDLAARADVSRAAVSRIERGEVASVPLRTLVRVCTALDASVGITVRWQGEELDRLADAAHAAVIEACVEQLQLRNWEARTEVSFNHFGDRGRVDVLARHVPSGTLLVVEAKSAIGDTQDTTGRLDVKARLGRLLAEQVGWGAPSAVIGALVVADSKRSRRIVADHPGAFARFSVRGRPALAWLGRPVEPAPSGLLWFVKLPDARRVSITKFTRVRTSRSGRSRSPGEH